MQYPNILSALHAVPHNEDIPVAEASESYGIESDYGEDNKTSEPESTLCIQDYCLK